MLFDSKMDAPSLLTLSRKDLTESTGEGPVDVEEDEEFLPLVLLQMPSSLSMRDLQSSRIVANHDQQQACLVVEESGKSFTVSRVETSNSLVLIPSQKSQHDGDELEQPPAPKKLKTTAGTCSKTKEDLKLVQTRLVKPGGSGASFLELKSKSLHKKDLLRLLKNHVFDPCNDAQKVWVGCTVSNLAMTLQCSQKEIKDALQKAKTFGMPRNSKQEQQSNCATIGYGTLSEEAIQETQNAIVATLTECDDFCTDYCTTKGIDKQLFEAEVLKRMEESETDELYPEAKYVVQHCTKLLRPEDENVTETDESTKVRLDFQKIAICVAHRVFQKYNISWEESEFISSWYHDLPGVGNEKPSIDLLHGVAICKGVERLWKYFPEHQLPLEPEARFDELFEEQERWTEDEFTPYIQRLAQGSNADEITDLIGRYTHVITESIDGKQIKIFMAKSMQTGATV